METLKVKAGRTLVRKITLRYPADYATASLRKKPIEGVYTTETLTLKIFVGDDITPVTLSGSTVAWLSATAGTITLTLDNSDTASMRGWYRLEVYITSASEPSPCFEAMLQVVPVAASGTAGAVYCTIAQVTDIAPWVGQLVPQSNEIQTDFGEQRTAARRWLNRELKARAKRALESQLERHAPIETTDAYEITEGVDGGPGWGDSTYRDTSLEAQLDTIAGYLDLNYVASTTAGLVDSDGTAAEIAANYSAYLISRSQISKEGQNPYADYGYQCRDRAQHLLAGYTAKVYTDDADLPYHYLEP